MSKTVYANMSDVIEFRAVAASEKTDYGVPGSPVFEEVDPGSIEVEEIWMFGRAWTYKQMVERFGKQGADAIMDEFYQLAIDEAEWSGDND